MENHINATQASGKQFYLEFHDKGKIVMLNLLKFKSIADYQGYEDLAANGKISGEDAYQLYMNHTLPELKKAGGRIIYYGKSNRFLIGPSTENWDAILLVEHESVAKFMQFAQNKIYLKGIGHRIAALADARLLPSTTFAPIY